MCVYIYIYTQHIYTDASVYIYTYVCVSTMYRGLVPAEAVAYIHDIHTFILTGSVRILSAGGGLAASGDSPCGGRPTTATLDGAKQTKATKLPGPFKL